MARIKKRGLDYFPVNTDFIHNRLVRRLMKREGDAAFTVLVQTLSYIYAGEGYYVTADESFYEDLADNLYETETADVKRIVALAVEFNIFDGRLFRDYGILTDGDIQRQFLFSTKRRSTCLIDERYCLLAPEELAGQQASSGQGNEEQTRKSGKRGKAAKLEDTERVGESSKVGESSEAGNFSKVGESSKAGDFLEVRDSSKARESGKWNELFEKEDASFKEEKGGTSPGEEYRTSDENPGNAAYGNDVIIPENDAIIPEDVTFKTENARFVYFGTHSIAQNSIAQHSIKNPLLNSSPGEGTAGEANRKFAEEEREENREDDFLKNRVAERNAAGGAVRSAEDSAVAPASSAVTPAGNAVIPADNVKIPADNVGIPVSAMIPADNMKVPAGNVGIPAGNVMIPVSTVIPAGNAGGSVNSAVKSPGNGSSRKEWTHDDIARLQPPADGLPRNLDGLIYNLRAYHVPPPEQYAIICKSNFGVIGHPMWRGFEEIRRSHGKIRQPGRYLLSLCRS